MHPAVELYCQPKLGTVEINRVVVDRLLSSKLQPADVPIAQEILCPALGQGLRVPKFA